MVSELRLNTVCSEARCPNIYECWNAGTATFMILGDTCTRRCGFCNVNSGKPKPGRRSPTSPRTSPRRWRVSGCKHAVITSVDRDDLPDGGARHFADVILAIRARVRNCAVEVLTPDFKKKPGALGRRARRPARRLRAQRRDGAAPLHVGAARLELPGLGRPAGRARPRGATATRSPCASRRRVMLGLGERRRRRSSTCCATCGGAGVDVVTLGQYLQPTREHLPVARFVHPDTFERSAAKGSAWGSCTCESGPLVRSSYHAERHAPRPDVLLGIGDAPRP